MPNWCSIKFNVSGSAEDLARFREAVRGFDDCQETPFDFNRLIPMPPELSDVNCELGTAYDFYYGDAEAMLKSWWVIRLGIETVEKLREHFDADPKNRVGADQYKANIEKYGCRHWYEWRCEHWGTKWNAYDPEVADNGDGRLHVRFYAAWCFPFPIFEKLVADFPTLTFEGLAEEPNMDIYISFQGCNGEFVWREDYDACKAAAVEFEDKDEDVTSEATT